MSENTIWNDSQDYGVDEILHISKKTLFCKITRIASEITTLFRVPPQLFQFWDAERPRARVREEQLGLHHERSKSR